MAQLLFLISALPALALLTLAAVLPRSLANRSPLAVRRWVSRIATLQLGVALLISIAAVAGQRLGPVAFGLTDQPSASDSVAAFLMTQVYLDGVSALMFLMVSFIGWVICRYSIRYLDGDASQGNFFRWTGFTLGAVSLMVISGDLVLFFVAWILTSVGLHHLLLHHPNRPAAQRAAWTKFAIVRIGDVALALAVVLLYSEFGTTQLTALFSAVASMGQPSAALQLASAMIVLAGAIKSAQFPFHTWLPQTLETPTPVSALMHAGIVNAGGYLIVRTSPIVSSTPWALAVLASVGAVTACYAALVMLTQSSVKKSLAYSTIAQMGFMMLQCGLGAFSAALLHILAHSMYKAHAFLSSGSLVVEPSASLTAAAKPAQAGVATASVFGRSMFGLAAAACSFGALTLAMIAVGTDPSTKPGGLILGAVLCLALTHWLINVFAAADRTLAIRGVAVVAGLCFAYAAAYRVVDLIAGTSVPSGALPIVQWSAVVLIVVIGFGSLFWFERSSARGTAATAGGRWFVHASNGFYVESTLRRVFGPLWSC